MSETVVDGEGDRELDAAGVVSNKLGDVFHLDVRRRLVRVSSCSSNNEVNAHHDLPTRPNAIPRDHNRFYRRLFCV